MNDNVRRLDVYIHTQPLSICHAYLPWAYKSGFKEQLSFRLSMRVLIVELNSAKHMTEDEQVLGHVQVALSARTCPSKLT